MSLLTLKLGVRKSIRKIVRKTFLSKDKSFEKAKSFFNFNEITKLEKWSLPNPSYYCWPWVY